MKEKSVRKILSSKVISVSPDIPLRDAVSLMKKNKISCLVVTDNKKPVGIFTERDLVVRMDRGGRMEGLKISELMSRHVVTADIDVDIYKAYNLLDTKRIRHLVIVNSGGELAGVITQSDIMKNLGIEYFVETKTVSKIMTRKVVTVKKGDPVQDAVTKMAGYLISCIVVEDNKYPVGILTERDVIGIFRKRADVGTLKIEKVMSQPVHTIAAESTVHEAAGIMTKARIRRLVVVDREGRLSGLITQSDIIKEKKHIDFLREIIRHKEELLEAKKQLSEKIVLENIMRSSIFMAIVATDMDFRIIYYNPFAEEIFGLKAAAGRTITEMLAKGGMDPSHFEKAAEAVRKGGKYTYVVNQQKEGENIFIESRISGIRDDNNSLVGFVLMAHDITGQKKVVEELRENEEKYRQLFENESEAIMVFDARTSRFEDANQATLDLYGYSKEEFLSLTVEDISGEKEKTKISIQKIKNEEPGSKYIPLRYFRKKDGTVFPGEVYAGVFFSKGRKKIIGAVHDITERKRMEKELLKADKLESIGILAGGIAYDFNNALTAILSNISLAKTSITFEDKVFKMLVAAEKASVRAQNLTHQLLTFSKGGEPVKKTVSIRGLVEDSVDFALSGSNVSCEYSFAEDLWPVEVDEVQITQAISNLIINADQAMPEGGIINVSAKNVKLGKQDALPLKKGNYVKLCIQDQGHGIPEEHLPKIFDPYFTTKQKGSGLGLATTYSIIKKHDGYITVESEDGVGTTFHIYLPASQHKALTKTNARERIIRGKGRVLVMEDEAGIRESMAEALAYFGYEAEFAEDGSSTITLYKKALESGRPFDVVIMDLTIPGGMGGEEAVKKLLEIDPSARAIVSSGYSNDQIMSDYKKYGFSGVITKPYQLGELSKVLHRVITGKK